MILYIRTIDCNFNNKPTKYEKSSFISIRIHASCLDCIF